MKHVLVTGGTGLLGFNIIQSLLKRNYTVKALVRDLEKGKRLLPSECELVQGDICQPETLATAFKDCQWVFHAAGFPEQWMKNNDTFEKVNVQGTANMIEAAMHAKIERFIHTSTIDVFEGFAHKEYDESIIDANPKGTYYERSKQKADQLVTAALANGLPAVFLHPAGLYGPGPTDSPGMNDFFQKMDKKQVPVLLPGGLPLVYGPDAGEAHVLAAEQAELGERYILCDQYFTLTALATAVSKELNNGAKKYSVPAVMPLWVAKGISIVGEAVSSIIKQPPLMPKGQLHFLQWQAIPVSKKAQKELGWNITPFQKGLKDTLKYLNIR